MRKRGKAWEPAGGFPTPDVVDYISLFRFGPGLISWSIRAGD
jgi:hypothetical protein